MITQKNTQCKKIIEYLIVNGSMTGMECVTKLGILNYKGRIFDLRKAGYTIQTIREQNNGKPYARYVLKEIPNGQRY